MRSGVLFASALLVAFPVLGACSLLDFEALDRNAGAASPDAASETAGDASSETASDSGLESGTDGGARECDRPHTFCEDFDHPGLESRWTIAGNDAGAPLIDDTKFTSPPSSLLTRLLVAGAPGSTFSLTKTFAPGGATKIDLSLTLGDVTIGPSSTLHAVALAINPPPVGFDDYELLVNIGGGVTAMVVTASPSGGAKFYEYALIDGTQSTWPARIRFAIDLTAPSATLFYQGTAIRTFGIPAASAIPSLDLTIGAVVDATASDDVRVRFDDVSLDLR